MTRHVTSLLLAGLAALPSVASADPLPGPTPPAPANVTTPPPSPFETGMRGFGTGLFAGLAGGYLFAREDGFSSRDWRPIVAGAGVGALAGGVLGLTLGMVDNSAAVPGRGFLVMRGMSSGGTFGVVAGAIIGGLAALKTDKPEHILFGAAIGTLTGTVVGLVYGSLEPNPWAASRRGPYVRNFGITPYVDARGQLAFGPSLSGTF